MNRFSSPPITPSSSAIQPAALREFLYDTYADTPKLLRVLGSLRPYVCPFDRLLPFVPAGASVIDFGCGHGALLVMMGAISRISKGIGCDIAVPALAAARAAARRLGLEDTLTFLPVHTIDEVPQGPFDVVSMVDVLHHVPVAEREAFIHCAASRVTPGGVFIFKDMTTRSRARQFAHQLDDWIFTREWVVPVKCEEVEQWANTAGLELQHDAYIPRLVYGNELRIFKRPLE
ncbi:class I SAM-dependent methyltransferase [Pseudomonas sp. Q1]|uniref:class I SAM-dependent methyltransferase n=1 Tax=Pseudomonas sp. Q1 TaxID=2202823 RepID=UPI0021140360|nr:class I SAM-dependent methyltransferase [Pseudomonas sp. Q1]NCE87615.1 hypothetical protein [Pseudomonas sp. Q1]